MNVCYKVIPSPPLSKSHQHLPLLFSFSFSSAPSPIHTFSPKTPTFTNIPFPFPSRQWGIYKGVVQRRARSAYHHTTTLSLATMIKKFSRLWKEGEGEKRGRRDVKREWIKNLQSHQLHSIEHSIPCACTPCWIRQRTWGFRGLILKKKKRKLLASRVRSIWLLGQVE